MKKTVEFLRADVVNANGYYYSLKTLKEAEKEHKDYIVPLVDNVPCDAFSDDADIDHLVGTITNFHVKGDSLYADVTVLDEFVETLKKFKENGIDLYLSPASVGELSCKEAKIKMLKPVWFTVKPAAKWRKPFLDE
jgi:hypothetical protein